MPITDGPGPRSSSPTPRATAAAWCSLHGPEALKILQGAEQQGLIDKVKWACATPCNDASLAGARSGVERQARHQRRAQPRQHHGPDTLNYRAVNKKYAPDIAQGSFSQMGYVAARLATKALLDIKGDVTKKSVNEAFKNIKAYQTDILCKPWSWGGVTSTCRTTRTARSCRRTRSS